MKLKRSEINSLFQAHVLLCPIDQKSVKVDLQLDSDVLWKLAVNYRRLKQKTVEFEEMRQDLAQVYSKGQKEVPPEKRMEFTEKLRELQGEMIEINLSTFLHGDFQVSENKINPMVLADMAPLISDFEKIVGIKAQEKEASSKKKD